MRLLEIISEEEIGKIDQNINEVEDTGSRSRALIIGGSIAEFLQSIGDCDLQIIKWNRESGKSTEMLNFSRLEGLIADLILEKLDCNMIKSVYSCRFISFGYDRQVHFCVKSEDDISALARDGVSIVDVSKLLIETDFFDGL